MSEKNDTSRVSVIISTYNRSKLLRLTVESVLAQTYPAIEIIVVDDGSTDDTPAVMEQYAEQIVYIRQENQGINGAITTGLAAASGEYIGILDHDDLYMPTKIERQVQILDSRPEVGLVNCGYYHIDENGNRLGKVLDLPEGNVLKELVCGDSSWAGGPLYRRKCFDEIQLSDSYCPDWEFMLRMALAGYEFALIREPLGCYRIVAGALMNNIAALEQGSIEVLDKVFSDPQLPSDVAAIKEEAYGNLYFYMSCRYYGAGQWDAAKQSLTKALDLRPDLLKDPAVLVQLFVENAFDPRNFEPVKFITNVLEHLPPDAEELASYRPQMLSQIYIHLVMKKYSNPETVIEAKHQLAEAIAMNPAILDKTDTITKSICHHALMLSGDASIQYVNTVFQNLPPEAQQLKQIRVNVLSEVCIGSAFKDYEAGRWRQTTHQILAGLRYRPSLVKNRGVLSIFLRSLPRSFV